MATTPWWARQRLWGHLALWITLGMFLILIGLTFDSLTAIEPGAKPFRVPAYSVINNRIDYTFDDDFTWQVPVISEEKAPLFGKELTAAEAEELVTHGKKVIQSRNCMNCHTLLGHGAYYAPDLTKSWLDPAWGSPAAREMLMLNFLQNPVENARTFGTGRRMPDLDLSEEEAKAVVAYLKWMSAINTNGFPFNFRPMQQGG